MSQTLTCEVGNHQFELSDADIAEYEKFGFEPLPICFPHQHQWRLSFRNDRFLHRRKCDLTGAEIISMYPQDSIYKIYERETWFSDKWDPLDYGRQFDFSKTFFEQYAGLQLAVPRLALMNIGSENSDYCNSCVYNKNCYLIFGGDRNENSMYGALPMFCKDCVDCDWTTYCELCYFSAYLEKCYGCRFAFHSKDSSNCAFIEDCIGCTECILSFNLRNKSYMIENRQYSKEEYMRKKKEILNGNFQSQQEMWRRFLESRARRTVKFTHVINGENVSGDIILNSKNCLNCFECFGSEDCRECWTILDSKDCFNADYIGHAGAFNFNNLSTDTAYKTSMSFITINSSNIEYCELIFSCKNLFGCVGLRHQEYAILNKKYSKNEFESLRGRIIEHMKRTGEWGRFFPKKLSAFPYNESTGSYFFPRTREEEIAAPKSQTYIIPDNINNVKDDILNATLVCEVTAKNFRIIPQELAFYRHHKIPIPRHHHDTRYSERLALRNPFRVWERTCAKCGDPIQTSYAPERSEKVLCEKCYLDAS
ncbi:hypothetical protein HYW82_00540 [Candidatus Peregrinibacteria bacterium]|nr:hypothetical protein [Candidatus Peregrinibacteria bacterium]